MGGKLKILEKQLAKKVQFSNFLNTSNTNRFNSVIEVVIMTSEFVAMTTKG